MSIQVTLVTRLALRIIFTLHLFTFASFQVTNRTLVAVSILPAPLSPLAFVSGGIAVIPGLALLISFTLYAQAFTRGHLAHRTGVTINIGPAPLVFDTAAILANMASFAIAVVAAFHWFT